MAPEAPPSVVIFDARLENGQLRGNCQYVEPPTPGTRLRVRWAVENQPKDFVPIGDGVAFIYAKDTQFTVVPTSNDASPPRLGKNSYRWTEGLNLGVPWLMFIMILPEKYTISQATPAPAGTRVFKERIALYWTLRGDDLGRTKVEWTLNPLHKDPRRELMRLNRLLSDNSSANMASLAIEDASSTKTLAHTVQRNPWKSGSFYLLAALVLIVGLGVAGKELGAYVLPAVLVAVLLLLVTVGALQLRNDEALKDESFVTLMLETLKRLPLLRPGGGEQRSSATVRKRKT